MIQEYITGLCAQMGIVLSQVAVVVGHSIWCLVVDLVHLHSGSDQVSVLVYRYDYNKLLNGDVCDRLEKRVWAALGQLQFDQDSMSGSALVGSALTVRK